MTFVKITFGLPLAGYLIQPGSLFASTRGFRAEQLPREAPKQHLHCKSNKIPWVFGEFLGTTLLH
jgi:hypothetical protein